MNRLLRALGLAVLIVLACAGTSSAGEQRGTVTFAINLQARPDAKLVKLWFPYPTSTLDQTISNLKFSGSYSSFTMAHEPRSGALYLYTEWDGPMSGRTLTVTFDAAAKARRVARLVESSGPIPPEVRKYIESDFWIPSDDKKIAALSRVITRGRKGILGKARAVYDWVVDNTRRDPDVPGCGLGDARATLSSRTGKCADISSVYVALARAAGVPAREVFGLRLGQPGETDITGGHHCWAEFYLPGTGWVPVDPADVRKVMLVKKLDLAAAKPYRDFYFGGLDEFRIVLQTGGRSLSFPEGNAEKVNYFMYPYAEVDGKPLDYCRPKDFRYTILFKAG
ncbi:MAG TPA: transglutaminase domain-containing protein [Candidatus Deferrimicrobiaceae bacterium]